MENATATGLDRPSASTGWRVVAMLWFVCFLNYADRQAIFSVFPKLKEEFGFSKWQLGLIGSAFMWVYAFGAPLAGYAGDRFRRKDLILGGCLFWSAVTMATGLCSRLWHFVAVRALEGFGETFYFPASMSLMSDYHGPRTRSRALSLHQSSVYIGTIAGSWAGAWFAESHGWRLGFYLFGGAGIVLAIVLYAALREPIRGAQEPSPVGIAEGRLPISEVGRAIFRSPTAGFLMAAFVCANFVATVFLAWTPTYLAEKFGFRLAAAGLSGTVYIHLASAAGAPLGGILADRLARRLRGGRMLVQMMGLLGGSLPVFLIGRTGDLRTLIASMVAFGFCKGLYDANIFAALFDEVEPRARATAAGLMNTVGWGGGALGPVVVGWASGRSGLDAEVANMSAAIAACGLVYCLGAALLAIGFLIARRGQVRPGDVRPRGGAN